MDDLALSHGQCNTCGAIGRCGQKGVCIFGRRLSSARSAYRSFVEKAVAVGRRPELTGGGLIRSVGGWDALKMLGKGKGHLKGDERILGDSDFVEAVSRGELFTKSRAIDLEE
jgi:hypothetical protein